MGIPTSWCMDKRQYDLNRQGDERSQSSHRGARDAQA